MTIKTLKTRSLCESAKNGGCAANAFHATGSIRGVYEPGCELFKKRIECAIMMRAAEADMTDR
ncbi:MAG: hypothetical protein HUJ80_00975 [Firmicutes bacterium]|nr:hypothetical protein [Bacillota bacterium]